MFLGDSPGEGASSTGSAGSTKTRNAEHRNVSNSESPHCRTPNRSKERNTRKRQTSTHTAIDEFRGVAIFLMLRLYDFSVVTSSDVLPPQSPTSGIYWVTRSHSLRSLVSVSLCRCVAFLSTRDRPTCRFVVRCRLGGCVV